MRFIVRRKLETMEYYIVMLGNRPGESRYELLGATAIMIRKNAKFGGAPSPEEDNRRWFDGITVGSDFTIKPSEV